MCGNALPPWDESFSSRTRKLLQLANSRPTWPPRFRRFLIRRRPSAICREAKADFIFQLNHETEFLNENSAQLGDEGIKVNAELEKLREEIRKEPAQNAELKKQLAAAEAQWQQGQQQGGQQTGGNSSAAGAASGGAEKTPKDAAAAMNDEGMRSYNEKQYAEAAKKFEKAAKLDPSVALYANNAGFACFKQGLYAELAQ